MKLFAYIVLLACWVSPVTLSTANAQDKAIQFTPEAHKAYRLIMQLRLNEARQSLDKIRQTEPNNYVVYFLDNYIDFFTLFIGESSADFRKLRSNKDRRLEMIGKTDPRSPYFLYCQAEINLQWALVRLKFEEYTKAFFEVRSAYNSLQDNVRKFPSFAANKKSLGVLHAAIGTIPDEYKWGVSWIGGMKGTIDQGVRELEEVISYGNKNAFIFREESVVMYAFVMLHLNNDPEKAWKVISASGIDAASSPLACFALSNIAIRTGRNEVAIQYLSKRPKGGQYYPFYYLDFMLGVAKLHRLDTDASKYLESYTKNFKGRNYIKEAYQKLAWAELVRGNTNGYLLHMANILKYGQDQLDEDKMALREARSGDTPHPLLLQARLLFDGGYLTRSYKLLHAVDDAYFTDIRDKLEYNYRCGRVAHSLSNEVEALKYYQLVIEKGKKNPAYYACNAALNTGLIYESQRKYDKAGQYFQLCLSMSPSEYRSGLHQKAKAGLLRIK